MTNTWTPYGYKQKGNKYFFKNKSTKTGFKSQREINEWLKEWLEDYSIERKGNKIKFFMGETLEIIKK